jgi:hypothetical protein
MKFTWFKILSEGIFLFLVLVSIDTRAQLYGTPDYYDVPYSYKKFKTVWDLKDSVFIKQNNKSTDRYTSSVKDGVLQVNPKISKNFIYGFNIEEPDTLSNWEIETKIYVDKSKYLPSIIILLNGKEQDTTANAIAFVSNYGTVITQSHVKGNSFAEKSDKPSGIGSVPYTITVRKYFNQMMLFIDRRFIGYFPKESVTLHGNFFSWVISQNQQLNIYSFSYCTISDKNQDSFLATHPAARLSAYDSLKKKVVFEENFDDNKNGWTDNDCKYTIVPTYRFSNGFLKVKDRNVRINNVLPKGNFECEIIIKRTRDAGRVDIGTDSCGDGGLECGLWANRVARTYYYLWIGEDYDKRFKNQYYVPQDDQIKFVVRRVDDVFYIFADDNFITAMYPYPQIHSGINLLGPDAAFDYIKVTELKN